MKKKLLIAFCTLLLITGCRDVKLKDGENAVVTFKNGGISSDQLYKTLKDAYGAEKIMDLMDTYLLKDKYKETQEEKDYIKQTIKSKICCWVDKRASLVSQTVKNSPAMQET